jgi:putative N6-adenine-specific DNA methylase
MRANLWLRSATRVLVRVARFRATAFFELERRAKTVPWDRFVSPRMAAEFRVTAKKSKLYHSDAIAERLQSAIGTRPEGATQLFIVRVVRDEFEISVDASGDLLHLRGYRKAIGKAPLRESLAAALVLAAEWTGAAPLLDPFCGSGTIPIEAALIARRMAPGARRHFAFMDWPEFDERSWRQERDRARSQQLDRAPHAIRGSDRDAGAVAAAQENAARAGVADDIEFSARAVSAIEVPEGPGLVATNPPYGIRASASKDVRNVYAQFGNVIRRKCAGWSVALFTTHAELGKQTRLPLKPLFRTTNGGLKVSALMGTIPAGANRT